MLKGITLMNSIFLSTSFQQSLTGTSYEGDMDVGEMFLNFRLHFSERKYFKVCYTNTDAVREEVEEITWFSRLMFGSKCLPYTGIQMMYRAMEVMLGDPDDETNIFTWDHIALNMPGAASYDPAHPGWARLHKLRIQLWTVSSTLMTEGQLVTHNYLASLLFKKWHVELSWHTRCSTQTKTSYETARSLGWCCHGYVNINTHSIIVTRKMGQIEKRFRMAWRPVWCPLWNWI